MMKYAILLVVFGVASAQFQNFDNQRNFNQPPPPPPPRPQSTFFDQPRPAPAPRPVTPFNNNPNAPNKYNSNYNRNDASVTIVKQYFDEQGNGAYSWGFQNSDGTERQEKIYFTDKGELGLILVKEGFYTYYDADARLVRVSYRADNNGFQVLEDTRLVA